MLGICNGFQILCEAGLLPGVLRPNRTLSFICRQVTLEVDDAGTQWSGDLPRGARLSIPIKNHDGAWFGDPSEGRVVFRYDETNPTGSHERIAGIANLDGQRARHDAPPRMRLRRARRIRRRAHDLRRAGRERRAHGVA